jgi:hypothetical protein
MFPATKRLVDVLKLKRMRKESRHEQAGILARRLA